MLNEIIIATVIIIITQALAVITQQKLNAYQFKELKAEVAEIKTDLKAHTDHDNLHNCKHHRDLIDQLVERSKIIEEIRIELRGIKVLIEKNGKGKK